MVLLRNFGFKFSNLTQITFSMRSNIKSYERCYSVFPPTYIKPIFDKKALKYLEASEEIKEIVHLPIKPAFSNERTSEFYDPVIEKFINLITRGGNKLLARCQLANAFGLIKQIQIDRYHKASGDKQEEIELDPKVILHKAIEHCAPTLELVKMKRGGQTYRVPVPIHEKRSRFLAMKWLIDAGKEKPKEVSFYNRLAYELIDAHNNVGRVLKKKQELYKQCEANRSYAHFRWT